MMTRARNLVAVTLVAMFVTSIAAPGLTMHNCRQFGTKSTQLCDCCLAELESAVGCCAKKSESAATTCHEPNSATLESTCCFVSYEGPFSFEGQSSLQAGISTSQQSGDLAMDHASAADAAPAFESAIVFLTDQTRHSSDPPSYIQSHSFRC